MIITILGIDYNLESQYDLERLSVAIETSQNNSTKLIAQILRLELAASKIKTDKALAIARKEQRHACADAIMNCNVHASSDWKKEAHSACINAYI